MWKSKTAHGSWCFLFTMGDLGLELGWSGWATRAFPHWGISPAYPLLSHDHPHTAGPVNIPLWQEGEAPEALTLKQYEARTHQSLVTNLLGGAMARQTHRDRRKQTLR